MYSCCQTVGWRFIHGQAVSAHAFLQYDLVTHDLKSTRGGGGNPEVDFFGGWGAFHNPVTINDRW